MPKKKPQPEDLAELDYATEPVIMREKTQSWLARWIHDESFWKDVTSQALGGLVVVVIAFIVAGLSGILGPSESVQRAVAFVVVALALLVISVVASLRLMKLAERAISRTEKRSTALAILYVFVLFPLAFAPCAICAWLTLGLAQLLFG